MHRRVQRLHPAVEHLGEAGEFRHILDLYPLLPQELRGAAGGQQPPAFQDPLSGGAAVSRIRLYEVANPEELAVKIPTYIIADQLGVPRRDMQKFKDWSDASIPIGLDIGAEAELERMKLVIEFQRYFLDRIFKGTRPGDIPIERASRFDLVVVEMSDRDAGQDGRWWDATNGTFPNFDRAMRWAASKGVTSVGSVSAGFIFGGSVRITAERTVSSMRPTVCCSACQHSRSFSA